MTAQEPAISLDDAARVLETAPFGRWWGFEVRALERGSATVALPARPELFRPGGVLQGGCCMTLADVAAWIAIMTLSGSDDPSVTLEAKTNFLRGAAGDLTCTARIVNAGRRVVLADASTFGPDGKLVAHHTVTYLRS